MRIDKYLADRNAGSRSEIKKMLKKGLISVNNVVIQDSGYQIKPESDMIICDCVKYSGSTMAYFMLHKPANLISATTDSREATVLDLFKNEPYTDLFPVGRLDKDTTGLLLISNDGELAHRLLSPKHHVDKTYLVHAAHELSEQEILQLCEGVDIGDEDKTLPAKLQSSEEDNTYLLTICEGRYHQIKRMFHAVHNEVIGLKRISMGPIALDDNLSAGEYRSLTADEIELLKSI